MGKPFSSKKSWLDVQSVTLHAVWDGMEGNHQNVEKCPRRKIIARMGSNILVRFS